MDDWTTGTFAVDQFDKAVLLRDIPVPSNLDAAIIDAARKKGREEMREEAARVCDLAANFADMGVQDAAACAAAIRSLPL